MPERDDSSIDGMPKTAFALHVSCSGQASKAVVDFTERKLVHAAKRATSNKVRNNIMTLLRSYCNGLVAIAWTGGTPVFHRVEKPKRKQSMLEPDCK